MQQIMPLILMFGVVIVFMVLPQIKRNKQEKKFREALKVGDKVITLSGIHGKLVQLSDSTCVVETMSGKIKFERTAISMEMTKKLNSLGVEKKGE